MSQNRQDLDRLARIESWESFRVILVCIAALCAFGLTYYVMYVPGQVRQLSGTVVTFETQADGESIKVRHTIHVRLDDGPQVRAAIGPGIVTKIGSRVRLIGTKMPIVGIERFRVEALIVPEPEGLPKLGKPAK